MSNTVCFNRDKVASKPYAENIKTVYTTDERFQNNNYMSIVPANKGLFSNTDLSQENIPIETQREQIIRFINLFEGIILQNKKFIQDKGNFKPMSFQKMEDGSILFEWIFPDFRIGFCFEVNPNESNWFIVTNEYLSEFSSSGTISTQKELFSKLIELINFVLLNS